ncbi:MAG: type I restriction enzyme HsdR N-terminal domain-containing protein [Bacteroidales bacterium]|nr:type I restriction enzyme HsdR N-terminal domain-containing protein [Bacteroidales bacterium]
MDVLNLPAYQYKIRQNDGKQEIFDPIRRKYIALTPEEWVRQHFIHYLHIVKAVPLTLITVEQELVYNSMKRRSDIVVYSNKGVPALMVECKAASVEITQKVFDQVARYNLTMKVPFLVVTNGLRHICCKIDFEKSSYSFLEEIPDYRQMVIT